MLVVGVTPGGFEKIFEETAGRGCRDKPGAHESAQHGSGGTTAEVTAAGALPADAQPWFEGSAQRRRRWVPVCSLVGAPLTAA